MEKGVNPYTEYSEYLALAYESELEFIISNTTESGILYDTNDAMQIQTPNSYPAKLTTLLNERFKYFEGDTTKCLTIIPCELINNNAATLKEIILQYCLDWKLEEAFIKHNLSSIALNSFLKFKVRRLPSLLGYIDKFGKVPKHLTFSLACLILFYKGTYKNKPLPVDDSPEIIDTFITLWKSNNIEGVVVNKLANKSFWDVDLNEMEGLAQQIIIAINEIEYNRVEQGFINFN